MPLPTPRTFLIALTTCAAVSLAACTNQQPNSNRTGDLSALQGRWEQLPDDPGGTSTPRQRVVKEVKGDTETVTTYGPTGQVLQAQTARFHLSRSGPVRVYTAENPKVTAGAGGGTSGTERRRLRYVYRIHGSEFDEVWGLLAGQEQREVVVKRWKRAGGASAGATAP